MMIADQYIWLVWSSAFLLPWVAIYAFFPKQRRPMRWASLFTTPFGLAEPLFVPEYWNPPSLFDLAARTGFDIEGLIFCFAIGGIGVVLYNILTASISVPVSAIEHQALRHRFHRVALATPFVVFPALYFLPWNSIYPSIVAMTAGARANAWCRPELKNKTWIGGGLFLGFYVIFLAGLAWSAPEYIERVWNLGALSGVQIFRMPLEELLFGFTFGMFWSGVYEHLTWTRPHTPIEPAPSLK